MKRDSGESEGQGMFQKHRKGWTKTRLLEFLQIFACEFVSL